MASEKKTAASKLTSTSVKVTLEGLLPIMFDKYPGSNKIQLKWHDKLYLMPGSNVLALPAINILSFLSAQNSTSAPKRLLPSKTYKTTCQACLSAVIIQGPDRARSGDIPFLRDGKDIEVGEFGDDRDPVSGIYKLCHVARLNKGIPNPKERPVLPLPWTLQFRLIYMPNNEVSLGEIHNLFVGGGQTIGLGTFRGAFGKFEVAGWEPDAA
jgi:hypothetical protein